MQAQTILEQFIKERPKVIGAFGYGSGVFKQLGYNDKMKTQLDLILITEEKELYQWHKENIKLNKKDYSMMGKTYIKLSKDNCGGHNNLTYTTNIKYQGTLIKYGVTTIEWLIKNLNTWDNFYLPARFQKPILPIITTKELDESIEKNRTSALLTAILMNEEDTSKEKILLDLCSLSYLGDTRMKFGENPNKVKNIVLGSYEYLEEAYDLKKIKLENLSLRESAIKRYDELPTNLQTYLNNHEIDLSNHTNLREVTTEFFTEKNKTESKEQTKTSFKTNGLLKSVNYGFQKVKKRINK